MVVSQFLKGYFNSLYKKFVFQSLYRVTVVSGVINGDIVMLVIHKHLQVVTNTLRLQHQ